MKPLHYYFLGVGAWFMAYGIQVVGFAWIVTIVLNESAKMVGLAQMAFLAPAMFLMLIGGSLADQVGARKVIIIGHIIASSAPLFLSLIVVLDLLNSLGAHGFVSGSCPQPLRGCAKIGNPANL